MLFTMRQCQDSTPTMTPPLRAPACGVRALRSGPVRFFTLLEGGPTTGPVILFQKYQKDRTGPYRTSPLWFRAVSGPVQTGPEPISVLTSHRTGQDWLSTY